MKNIIANLGSRKDAQMFSVMFVERNRNITVQIIFKGKQTDKDYYRRLQCKLYLQLLTKYHE